MLRHAHRLSKKADFQTVYREGKRTATEHFSILTRVNALPVSRFSVVVRRSFGTAVLRNKAKRRARVLFFRARNSIVPAMDILFFPKSAMMDERPDALEGKFRWALEQARSPKEKK